MNNLFRLHPQAGMNFDGLVRANLSAQQLEEDAA